MKCLIRIQHLKHPDQCCRFSPTIAYVTPDFFNFYYQKIFFKDQSIFKKLFNFEKNFTDPDLYTKASSLCILCFCTLPRNPEKRIYLNTSQPSNISYTGLYLCDEPIEMHLPQQRLDATAIPFPHERLFCLGLVVTTRTTLHSG